MTDPGAFGDPNLAAGADVSAPTDITSLWGASAAVQSATTLVRAPTPDRFQEAPPRGGNRPITTTVGKQLQNIYNQSPAQILALQQQMLDGGLYDGVLPASKTPAPGVVDDYTYKAYTKLIVGATRAGVPFQDYLENLVSANTSSAGSTPPTTTSQPHVTFGAALTPAADVRSVGNTVWQSELGRRMTDGEVQAVTKILNSQELSAKTQEANASYSQLYGGGQTNAAGTPVAAGGAFVNAYQAAPSPSAAAEEYANQNDKPEVVGRTAASAMQSISQFVGQK